MKLGILIATYNRPAYLQQCLASLKRADIPEGTEIIIVDDASTDIETIRLIEQSGYDIIRKNRNAGICDSLIIGFNYLYCKGVDAMMNLDSDAIVRNDFIQRILELPDERVLKTGFHCTTKNANGTDRHKIIEQHVNYNIKASVGGINICFKSEHLGSVRNSIRRSQEMHYNWDHQLCLKFNGAVSVNQSVIQHIGVLSSMNHIEKPDIADTFKPLALNDVTLICVDDDYNRAAFACNECLKNIIFGDVKIVSTKYFPTEPVLITIPPLNSKRAYSEFIMHEVYKYCDTSHMLIVQHDGYVKNWQAWDKTWLQYDYIGAVWEFYRDAYKVGNGGFSLRSKRLMKLVSKLELRTDKEDNGHYAEDHSICRIYRRQLEAQGMKFAPIEVARKFSIEGWGLPVQQRKHSGQFGFHGKAVIF